MLSLKITAFSAALLVAATGLAMASSDSGSAGPGPAPSSGHRELGSSPSSSGSSTRGEADIKKLLESNGYSDVAGLKQHRGLWTGHAKRNGKRVTVEVDQADTIIQR